MEITLKFILPEGLVLMNAEMNERWSGDEAPFSWTIENSVLYYYDIDGEKQEIQGEYIINNK
jgi:hypothetical protein